MRRAAPRSGSIDGVLLGSGGWIPTSRRETCSALLRRGSDVLIIDAGTGLHRLIERPDLVAGAENIHIVLTHFHLDHVVGLSYLPALPFRQPPMIWGPGQLVAGTPTRSILGRLLGPPLFSAPLATLASEVLDIPGAEFELDSFALAVRVQNRHSEPTLALRIGDALTYCTDTGPDPENIRFAAGSYVLLHEAWYAENTSDDDNHTAAGDAGRIARQSEVEHLVLIHVNPLQDSDNDLANRARVEFPTAEVGVDLARIPQP